MSNEDQVPSGQPQNPGGIVDGDKPIQSPGGTADKQTDKDKQTVAYDTYAKTLAQEKALRDRLAEAENKLQEAERKRLELEGNKDELIKSLKDENATIKAEREKEKAEKTHARISSQIKEAALKMGCVDTDLASSLVDFSKLDIDSSATVSNESLNVMLSKLKESKPYMFQAQKPGIADAAPGTKVTDLRQNPANYTGMTHDQQMEAFKKQLQQTGL